MDDFESFRVKKTHPVRSEREKRVLCDAILRISATFKPTGIPSGIRRDLAREIVRECDWWEKSEAETMMMLADEWRDISGGTLTMGQIVRGNLTLGDYHESEKDDQPRISFRRVKGVKGEARAKGETSMD